MQNHHEKTSSPGTLLRFFVVPMGIVSLFADMTYEGGASIHALFLGKLGASAAAITIIEGVGEFLGYATPALPVLFSLVALIMAVVIFAMSVQLISIPLFTITQRITHLPLRLSH